MHDATTPQVEWAVGLIERYLALNPDAADNADGVARWWLTRQCCEEMRAVADEALAEAMRRGLVRPRTGAGDELIYERADWPAVRGQQNGGERPS